MNFLRRDGENFVFELGAPQRRLLRCVVALFPLVPRTHQPISRTSPREALRDSQAVLDEAMAALRQGHRRKLDVWLGPEGALADTDETRELTLTPADVEWLLQILNDVRVGSWLKLGCPETDEQIAFAVNQETLAHLAALQACLRFQVALLEARTEG